jgi:hypothetical protein
MKITSARFSLARARMAIVGLDSAIIFTQSCPPASWTYASTCTSCRRSGPCVSGCNTSPTYGSWGNCGSYQYVQGCRETVSAVMYCPNCPGQPVTQGMAYQDQCNALYNCTSGVCVP